MYLPDVEKAAREDDEMRGMLAAMPEVPEILYLFAFRKDRTRFLTAFTQEVMRGPSPLSAGTRELIAAMTSHQNRCSF